MTTRAPSEQCVQLRPTLLRLLTTPTCPPARARTSAQSVRAIAHFCSPEYAEPSSGARRPASCPKSRSIARRLASGADGRSSPLADCVKNLVASSLLLERMGSGSGAPFAARSETLALAHFTQCDPSAVGSVHYVLLKGSRVTSDRRPISFRIAVAHAPVVANQSLRILFAVAGFTR